MMTPAPGSSRAPWLLTWEELHRMPSQAVDNFSYQKEESYRCSTASFIQEVGRALRFPQLSISTALVFMHRFYARKSFVEYDRFITACTCLLLGGKVEETPKKLKDVLSEAYKKRFNVKASEVPDPESRKFWELREQVLVSERVLLQTLGFDLQLEHPYRELLAYVKSVHMTRDFAQLAWNFVNDSYRTLVCLQYDHKTIAAAAIAMAASYFQASLSNPVQPERPWYEAISPYTSEADVFACANTVVDFYELIAPKIDPTEPGSQNQVQLTPVELQRIRDSTGGATVGATALPSKGVVAAVSEATAATKRAREEPVEGNGADGHGEAAKHHRTSSTALASSPPHGGAAAARPDSLPPPSQPP